MLDELIDDKLKVQLSKRYIAEVPKREIETAFANIARRAGMTPQQFAKVDSSQAGVSAEALKARIHADFVWSQIIRGKFQGSLQVGEKEVEVKMQGANRSRTPTNYEYKLRPVLFLVPRGAAPTAFEARKQRGRSAARPLPELRRGPAARDGAAGRRGARDDHAPVGRSRPAAARGAQQHAGRPPDAARHDAAGRRDVRGMQQEPAVERRHARASARCATRCTTSDIRRLSKKFLKELRSQALIEIQVGA